jgi:hypothetical protein
MNYQSRNNDYSFQSSDNESDFDSDFDLDESDFDSDFDLDKYDKKITLIMNDTQMDWYKYHIVFPHDDDDEHYELYYEDKNGIFEKTDSYLILKINNNRRYLKELSEAEYDAYQWNENEFPISYNGQYYE